MTNQPTGQPMSRRERRALEGPAFQPAGAVPVQPGLPQTLVEPLIAPVSPPAPVPEAPVLSRRERRQLEQAGAPAGAGYDLGQASPVTPTGALAVLGSPLTPAPPLPPVFATLASGAPATQTTTTPSFGDAVPAVTPSRTVGQMATTTSSLIIPETPTIDIAGPLGHTGEVVVTGQIRLPQSLAEVGSLPALVTDRDDDEVMDSYTTGAIAASAKPLRASQAVSGKGDDSDIVMVRRARWGTAAVVTSLGAAVLGFAAVALLILAVMTDVLG